MLGAYACVWYGDSISSLSAAADRSCRRESPETRNVCQVCGTAHLIRMRVRASQSRSRLRSRFLSRVDFPWCNGENQGCVLGTRQPRTFGGGRENSTPLLLSKPAGFIVPAENFDRSREYSISEIICGKEAVANKSAVENARHDGERLDTENSCRCTGVSWSAAKRVSQGENGKLHHVTRSPLIGLGNWAP